MRFLLLLIVLIFPLLDLWITARFAHWIGVPLWFCLGSSLLFGSLILRNERLAFREKTIAAMHGEHPLLRGLLDSGRKVLAAMLLILPGTLSDTLAIVLLLLPINVGPRLARQSVESEIYTRRPN